MSSVIKSWDAYIISKVEEFEKLKPGWDGFRGAPLTPGFKELTLKLLEYFPKKYKAPSVVPGSGGDMQIEWHTSKDGVMMDLEVNLTYGSINMEPDTIYVWFHNSLYTDVEGCDFTIEKPDDYICLRMLIENL